MISHVAFLRAINTGGRRVTNNDLIAAVQRVGFIDATAYQASGNVLIGDALGLESSEIAERLAAGLREALGYEVPAIVRTSAELVDIVATSPFGADAPLPGSKPQVILLAAPAPDPIDLDDFAPPEDRLALVGRDIHWWPREGISASDLDVAGLERSIGTMTVRSIGTIQRIVGKAT